MYIYIYTYILIYYIKKNNDQLRLVAAAPPEQATPYFFLKAPWPGSQGEDLAGLSHTYARKRFDIASARGHA